MGKEEGEKDTKEEKSREGEIKGKKQGRWEGKREEVDSGEIKVI